MYPNHDTVLNNIGAQLFRLGYAEEAAAYIRKSLLVNPGYLAARDNLENICSHLVERWHFPMLNDKRRNFAYQFAIDKAIRSGYDTVLDIGTGTGILSLMCEHSGARKITACDRSRAMIEVAKDVLTDNDVGDRISLVHKSSTDLLVPTDINKVRLVVTETFDAGLFGEHIVSTMIHAWKNLISTSPMGTSIPCGATMYVCGIECETIRRRNRLLYPVLQHLDLSCVEILCSTGHIAEEPYTTENLSSIRGGYKILTNIAELLRVNFTNLCELESLNGGKSWLSDLYVKQKGRLDALAVWFDLHLDDTVTISTAANNKSCWEQAIYPVTSICRKKDTDHDSCMLKKKETLRAMFHFEQDCLRLNKCEVLYFGTVGEKHQKKHTNPFKNISSDNKNGSNKSDSVSDENVHKVEKTCKSFSLPFRKRKVDPSKIQSSTMSDSVNHEVFGAGTESNIRESVIQSATFESLKPFTTTHGVVVNGYNDSNGDREFPEHINANTSTTNSELGMALPQRRNSTDMYIGMERCSIDPEENIDRFFAQSEDHSENCHAEIVSISNTINCHGPHSKLNFLADEVEIEFLNDIHLNKQMCKVLDTFRTERGDAPVSLLLVSSRLSLVAIQAKKMGYTSIIHATQEEHHGILQQVAALNGCRVGEITLIDLTYLRDCNIQTDVIVCDVVEPCGALKQQVLEDITFHRETSLKEDGLLVPCGLRIMGLFIESEELDNLSHVTGNDKTLEYKIAEHINVFQMLNHVNIDMSTLTYTKLSETFELFDLDLASRSGDSSLCSIQKTLEKTIDVINTGQISALVYWFEVKLDQETTICTLDSRCHWKQAAVMIKKDYMVVLNDKLTTKITLQNSCLDVSIVT